MSIRTQLAIWYSAVFALALALFAIGVYAVVSFTLLRQVDVSLEESVSVIASGSSGALQDGQRIIKLPQLDVFRTVFVQAIGPDGKILASSMDGFEQHLDPTAFAEISRKTISEQKPVFTLAQHANAPQIRVYTYPLVGQASGQLFGYLQVGTPLEEVSRATSGLLVSLVAVGAVGLLLSSLAGAALARRALQPVEKITQAALDICRTDNLDQRVQVRSNDEVGRLASAFNEMLERLSELLKAEQRLVADVSHEMRTPLTVIRGNVDLLRLNGSDRESLDAISGESERMTRLVSDLLLLSQADAGMLPMYYHPVDLGVLIAGVARSGNLVAEGRVAVDQTVAGNVVVQGDRDRLQQVMLNLVDNAIQHTPDGGTVRITATATDTGMVVISVSDTGEGIPAEDLPHIFDRFYRVDKSRSRAHGGAGLGLAIAQSIARAHGGEIEVQSAPGAGTTFNVWLPAYQPNLV